MSSTVQKYIIDNNIEGRGREVNHSELFLPHGTDAAGQAVPDFPRFPKSKTIIEEQGAPSIAVASERCVFP